jgi:uncharacterized protein (TIGR02266 family)
MRNLPAAFREYKRLERIRDEKGFSLQDLERWTSLKRMLTEHFRPGAGQEIADKQSSLRVPIRLRVEFGTRGALRQSLMTNISRGGVFVSTDDPLPIGTPLELRVRIDEDGQEQVLRGDVVSVNTGASMTSGERGMGVSFSNLSADDEAWVKQLYGQAMDAADLVGD